jgi:alpha-tubulin suppressor-like RCC1 family protein
MSQEKAQLIAPLGNMTVPGVTATGVITATSFEGNISGAASSIKQGSSISAGVVTASSFTGNLTGNIQRLADSAPNISVGVVTATSFSGNLTGSVTDLTSQPAISVGVVTATSFSGPVTGDIRGNITGNVSGVATGSVTGDVSGLAQGGLGVSYNGGWPGAGTSQISAGVVTATSFYGDGSNLDGVSSGPVSAQSVTANSGTTAIDLSSGNLIYMTQSADTTVSFANSENGNVYIIRTKDDNTTARTITWPTGIGWSGGTAPTLLTNPRATDAQVFLLVTRNMGETWYGKEVMKSDPQTTQFWWTGNLGPVTNTAIAAAYRSSPTQVGTNTNWSYIYSSVSSGRNAALKNDGTLWVWGQDAIGWQGLNVKDANLSSPTQIPGTTWGEGKLMGDSGRRLGVIKTDGTLWMWGRNEWGSLGINLDMGSGSENSRSSPTQVGTDKNWASVSGNRRSWGIKTDGTLWAWGYNSTGELGNNDTTSRSSPTQVGTNTNWAVINSGSGQSSIVVGTKTDGTLWSWGGSTFGEGGTTGDRFQQNSSPVQVGTDTNWGTTSDKLSNGQYRVMAIKTDGTLWVCGRNNEADLGLNDTVDRSSPTQIPGTTWKSVSTNANTTLTSKTDGTLWVWGNNEDGALGLNQSEPAAYSSPTQIPGASIDTTATSNGYAVNMLQGNAWLKPA